MLGNENSGGSSTAVLRMVHENPRILDSWRESAAAGDVEAQFAVAVALLHGAADDGAEAATEAVRLLRMASNLGHASSMFELGECLALGVGTARDEAEAARLWRHAAEQGHEAAQARLAASEACNDMARAAAATEVLASPPESQETEMLRAAASNGDVEAQIKLGAMVENDEEAARLFQQAASKGNAEAQFRLGLCHFDGTGMPQSDAEAVRLFRLAAQQGTFICTRMCTWKNPTGSDDSFCSFFCSFFCFYSYLNPMQGTWKHSLR